MIFDLLQAFTGLSASTQLPLPCRPLPPPISQWPALFWLPLTQVLGSPGLPPWDVSLACQPGSSSQEQTGGGRGAGTPLPLVGGGPPLSARLWLRLPGLLLFVSLQQPGQSVPRRWCGPPRNPWGPKGHLFLLLLMFIPLVPPNSACPGLEPTVPCPGSPGGLACAFSPNPSL